jgi:hypothetical protein
MTSANTNLHKAKNAKNDEFYTQLTDVSNDYSANDFVFGDLRRLEFIVAQFYINIFYTPRMSKYKTRRPY